MLRNELEYRNAKKQIEDLRTELEKRNSAAEEGVSRVVADALEMKIGDIEGEIAEYEALKEGLVSALNINSFDDVGELIIKARIARNWSQADLAKALDMDQQQVQRYERNDWQKISLWKLQEVVEVLELDVAIHARLQGHKDQSVQLAQAMTNYRNLNYGVMGSVRLNTGRGLEALPIETGFGRQEQMIDPLSFVFMSDVAAESTESLARHTDIMRIDELNNAIWNSAGVFTLPQRISGMTSSTLSERHQLQEELEEVSHG